MRSVLYPAAALMAVAVLARLPLFGVPLDSDEGGYAEVAHRWAQGGHLYSNPWVDRPQGLLLVFRAVTDISYSVTAIRVAAVLAGVTLTLGVAAAAWAVGGRRAGLVAGTIAAVVGAGSFIEGYEFNGELIGSAIGTSGVALALWWSEERLAGRWLFVAALACGAAPLIKQSMLDAPVALLCVVAATRRWRSLSVAAAGLLTWPLFAVVWAWHNGWAQWWYAVVRFQFSQSTAGSVSDRLTTINHNVRIAAFDLVGLTCAALLSLAFTWRRPGRWPLVAWLTAALLGTCGGAFIHPHYWVQVVAPLAVLAGTVSLGVQRRRLAFTLQVAVAVLALALPLARLGALTAATPRERAEHVVPRSDPQRLIAADVARWVDAHTESSESVYVFVAAADLYLRTGRTTTFPYLWYTPVAHVPDARLRLRQWLSGEDAPTWILVYNAAQYLDPTGRLGQVLDEQYRQVAIVDGHPVLRHRA